MARTQQTGAHRAHHRVDACVDAGGARATDPPA